MSEIVEKSVIGAILIDPKYVSEIYEQIRLEMFGSSFCRSVYAEILKAYDSGKPITLISIAQKLQGENFSQERIMQELKGILPDIQAYKIKSYADALVAEYKTRRLKEMLSKIIPAAGVVDEQINTMLQELEAMKENDTVKIHALSEIVDSISDGYFKEPDTEPLYTGLEKLDNTLGRRGYDCDWCTPGSRKISVRYSDSNESCRSKEENSFLQSGNVGQTGI